MLSHQRAQDKHCLGSMEDKTLVSSHRDTLFSPMRAQVVEQLEEAPFCQDAMLDFSGGLSPSPVSQHCSSQTLSRGACWKINILIPLKAACLK